MNGAAPPPVPGRIGPRALVAGGVALFLSCVFCVAMSRLGGDVAYVWIPNALALVLVLRSSRQEGWKWIALHLSMVVLVNLGQGSPPIVAAGYTLANGLDVLLGLAMARLILRGQEGEASVLQALRVLGLLAVSAIPASALVGATSVWIAGGALLDSALDWAVSDLLGMALVLLPGLTLSDTEWTKVRTRAFLGGVLRAAPLVLTLAAAILVVLPFPFAYLALLFIVVAVRRGTLTMVVLAQASVAVLAVLDFSGAVDFPLDDPGDRYVWLAAAATFVIAWAMGMTLEEMRRKTEIVKRVDAQFRGLLDSVATGFALLDRQGRVVEVNRSFLELIGLPRERAVGEDFRSWIEPADRTTETVRLLEPGGVHHGNSIDLRYRTAAGHLVFGRTQISPLPGTEEGFLAQVENVTQALQAERELRQGKAVLQTVIDNMPGLVAYWDSGLRNRFANRAYWDWYGMEFDDLQGRSMREVVGETQFELTRTEVEGVLSGRARFFEKEFLTPMGQRFLMMTFIPDLQDGEVLGFYSFVSDVTQLRQAQKAQLDTLARLRGIIDGATEFSIVATGTTGQIELFSAGAERMLGYKASEMVGKANLLALHDRAEISERARSILASKGRIAQGVEVLFDAARHGESESQEWTYLAQDGRRIPVQLVVTALHDHDGRISGFLGVARDIAAEKDVMRVMAEARYQAEKASQLKGEFVANMSHEIRTPMNAVLGMAQLMESTNLTPNQKRYLDMIQKSGKSLLGILDDILDFSKIEAGKLHIDPVEFSLDDVLENVANIGAVAAQGKGLEIAMVVDPEVPVDLVGDPLRLQQILVNLVGNAIKFTSVGHVAVNVDLLSRDGGGVELGFRVEDSGIGMTDEQQRRIFHPFAQADGSMTRRFGGTGLGLAISKRLAEMMGGRLGVRSKMGNGTEFYVSLPFPLRPAGTVAPRPGVQKAHLLLIVHETRTRRGLEWAAVRHGWRTSVAGSLDEAIDLVRVVRPGDEFDLIVVDAQVPGWSDQTGIGVLRAACPSEVPVVKLAGFHGELGADRHFRLLDGLLVKPVAPSALRKLVGGILGHGSSGANSGEQDEDLRAMPLRGVRVLLVEDNAFNQVVATETLRNLGAEPDLAENGKVAVDRLAVDSDYDVVLMDVQMPIMDGYTATRAIRDQLHLSLPILAMTAGVLPSDRDRCLESGMDDFLTKPFQVETLVRVIREHLHRSGQAGRASRAPESTPPESSGGISAESDVVQESDPSSPSSHAEAPLPVPAGVEPGVFEPQRMVAMLGAGDGSEALVRKLVGQFLDLTPRTLDAGREAIAEGRQQEAIRAYHNLKSTSASLGALGLSAAARLMEERLSEGGLDGHDEPRRDVEREFERVEVLARRWLEA